MSFNTFISFILFIRTCEQSGPESSMRAAFSSPPPGFFTCWGSVTGIPRMFLFGKCFGTLPRSPVDFEKPKVLILADGRRPPVLHTSSSYGVSPNATSALKVRGGATCSVYNEG